MPGIVVNSNTSALSALRRLHEGTSGLRKHFERLSSGLRVSSAADDSAGLAVASALKLDSTVTSQGARNAEDGASAIATAESALRELQAVVVRQRELAQSAANGTYSYAQRKALNNEAQVLSQEFNRIVNVTSFNGRQLLQYSAESSTLTIQTGYGQEGSITLDLTGEFARVVGDGTYSAAETYLVTSAQRFIGIELADLNRDGFLDRITANGGDDTLFVGLGNGDGSFAPAKTLTGGNRPREVTTGDLNNDGILDIISANYSGQSAGVYIGNGDGTFKAATTYAVGSAVRVVIGTDVNGDGFLDLVAGGQTNNTVNVFLNKGDGTFNAKTSYTVAGTAHSVTAGDFNGDGAVDLASAHFNGAVSVLLNSGAGTFSSVSSFAAAPNGFDIKAGDLNADGRLDIATVSWSTAALYIQYGNGDGTFQAAKTFGIASNSLELELTDINEDGLIDIAASNLNARGVSLLIGNGDGTFEANRFYSSGAATGTEGLAIGDIDGDSVRDVVLANYDQAGPNNSVSVLFGNGTHTTAAPKLNLLSTYQARAALDTTADELQRVARGLSELGSAQNRLVSTISNLEVAGENFAAAASQILDVDVAGESAALLRAQIVQQAANAILAQANQAPSLALKLIG